LQISDSFGVLKKVLRPQSDLGPIYRVNKQIIKWSEWFFGSLVKIC